MIGHFGINGFNVSFSGYRYKLKSTIRLRIVLFLVTAFNTK
ncbi:hypothetical protein IGK74_001833 [Enterococcus sp. AZ150]|uniref:Uncharacterized protein n=1 Tax=Enterococcus sulfureus ATCC 49903 TaxID=1140003 RepID=S0PG79_9ENTE|nr:hypothetical protein OMY_00732 [Enterococcus sulfureus ATCC 49903]EOT87668.1 hypothetical protein I573_00725 [Enterococcus sulfureus ATCC 49903]